MRYAPFLVASAFAGTWAQANDEAYAPKFRRGSAYINGNYVKARELDKSASDVSTSPKVANHHQIASATASQATSTQQPTSVETSSAAQPQQTSDSHSGLDEGQRNAIVAGVVLGVAMIIVGVSISSGGCKPGYRKREVVCKLPERKVTKQNAVEEVQKILPDKSEAEVEDLMKTMQADLEATRTPAQMQELVDTFRQENLENVFSGRSERGAELLDGLRSEYSSVIGVPLPTSTTPIIDESTSDESFDLKPEEVKVNGDPAPINTVDEALEDTKKLDEEIEQLVDPAMKDAEKGLADLFGQAVRAGARRRRAY